MLCRYFAFGCLSLYLAGLLPAGAEAKDFFLTIGGGYSVTGNQVSLERNVLFQRQVLAEARPDAEMPETYFAGGDSGVPDLQYRDPKFDTECPRARRLMAMLFGNPTEVDLRYRQQEIPNLDGPAERRPLERRFKKLARELTSGDRLIIYFTGHGGSAEDPDEYSYDYEYDEYDEYDYSDESEYNEHDTTMYLWDDDQFTASEFGDQLDLLPKDVTVVLVMVQCYSGGFAHTIFNQSDAELGLADYSRCGFFSQRHDRFSAGCTPDVEEAEYQEYSSFFWAAVAQRTRGGEPIAKVDYNEDGQISLAEAHAYAVIHSDTIDVPIRTSGALLRKYSSLASSTEGDSDDEDEPATPLGALFGLLGKKSAEPDEATKAKLITLSGPIDTLLKSARTDQRQIVEELVAQLELNDSPTVESIRGKQKQIKKLLVRANSKSSLAQNAARRARNKLKESLAERWPELNTAYSPLAAELCSERADEFMKAVESMPALDAFEKSWKKWDEAAERVSAAEHLEAKCERLLRTCENIVLAANLPLIAPKEIVARYENLLKLEEASIAPAKSRPVESTDESAASNEEASKAGDDSSSETASPGHSEHHESTAEDSEESSAEETEAH